MTIKQKAAEGGLWLAGLTSISQIISWVATISVANLLNPVDYGLMTMAGFLTAYIEYLSDMGIGASVVQKNDINKNELSSLFWMSMAVGTFFAIVALCLAYPTSLIFNESKIIPITYLISINFIIGSISSIPNGILRRDFKFKYIGISNMIAAIVSCVCQVIMAANGYGVYTLILGVIILRTMKTILVIIFAKWIPLFHFTFKDVKPYYRFGLGLAGGSAIYRLYESLDKFIVGKIFNATQLGNYGFASNLASLPSDKIMPIFQQVTFPLLARLQHDEVDRNNTFLTNLKLSLYLTSPLFIAGTSLGNDIVIGLLGEKWSSIITMFRVFCAVKLIELISSFCGILFTSGGNSKALLKFNILQVLIMPAAILVAALYGFKYLIIPWATIYPVMLIWWTFYTLKFHNVNILKFIKTLVRPLTFGIVFSLSCFLMRYLLKFASSFFPNSRIFIIVTLVNGAILSIFYLFLFDKEIVTSLMNIRKKGELLPKNASV